MNSMSFADELCNNDERQDVEENNQTLKYKPMLFGVWIICNLRKNNQNLKFYWYFRPLGHSNSKAKKESRWLTHPRWNLPVGSIFHFLSDRNLLKLAY